MTSSVKSTLNSHSRVSGHCYIGVFSFQVFCTIIAEFVLSVMSLLGTVGLFTRKGSET